MPYFKAFDDKQQASGDTQISGVHETPTRPAPYVEELSDAELVGSIPIRELSIVFAPVVALRNGNTLGFQASARCHAHGLEEPDELFARAVFEQRTGELGRELRSLALSGCPDSPVYIHVHPSELKESWLIRPDDPVCFHEAQVFLELSQPAYSVVCLQVIEEMRTRSGISLVLDDFGAGASTLRQLAELQPVAIKLDESLIAGIERSVRKQTLLRGLVRMCQDFGVQVIAKGIESETQLRVVRDCGVPYGQGHLLGAPAPLPAASAWQSP